MIDQWPVGTGLTADAKQKVMCSLPLATGESPDGSNQNVSESGRREFLCSVFVVLYLRIRFSKKGGIRTALSKKFTFN